MGDDKGPSKDERASEQESQREGEISDEEAQATASADASGDAEASDGDDAADSDDAASGSKDESDSDEADSDEARAGDAKRAESSSAAASEAGVDTRWIGYIGGLVIIGASLMNITGERNMFAKAEASPEAEEAPSGPCDEWQNKVCESAGGPNAHACTQAKGAAALLTDRACRIQLSALTETLEAISTARADCTALVDKLCEDVGAGTPACQMVQSRTPTFPPENCTKMMESYDKVLSEVKQVAARMGGGGPPGAHPGAPKVNVSTSRPTGADPHAGRGSAPHPAPPKSAPPTPPAAAPASPPAAPVQPAKPAAQPPAAAQQSTK
jgi:hypothetical protein